MASKIAQSYSANTHRKDGIKYKAGDLVILSTINRRKDYKNAEQSRVSKLIPTYDGPYKIMDVNNNTSIVELHIPSAPNIFPKFHTLLIKPFQQNNDSKYPSRMLDAPGPIEVNGEEEFFIDQIVDHKKVERSYKYLVHWKGEHAGADRWITEK